MHERFPKSNVVLWWKLNLIWGEKFFFPEIWGKLKCRFDMRNYCVIFVKKLEFWLNAPKSAPLIIQKQTFSCQNHLIFLSEFSHFYLGLNWIENSGLFVNGNYCTFCELNTAGHRWKLITVWGLLVCHTEKYWIFYRVLLLWGKKWSRSSLQLIYLCSALDLEDLNYLLSTIY